jgi:hypothetical protein
MTTSTEHIETAIDGGQPPVAQSQPAVSLQEAAASLQQAAERLAAGSERQRQAALEWGRQPFQTAYEAMPEVARGPRPLGIVLGTLAIVGAVVWLRDRRERQRRRRLFLLAWLLRRASRRAMTGYLTSVGPELLAQALVAQGRRAGTQRLEAAVHH